MCSPRSSPDLCMETWKRPVFNKVVLPPSPAWHMLQVGSPGSPLPWRGGLPVGCLLRALWGYTPMEGKGRRRGAQLPGSLHEGLGPP